MYYIFLYARFTSWTSLIFVNMCLHSGLHFKQVLTEADYSPLYHSPLCVKWLECHFIETQFWYVPSKWHHGEWCLSLCVTEKKKKKKALKLFLALTTAINTGEENDKTNSHTLSLIPSPSISTFLSLASHTHSQSNRQWWRHQALKWIKMPFPLAAPNPGRPKQRDPSLLLQQLALSAWLQLA